MFPLGELGVAVPLLVTEEVKTEPVVVQVRALLVQLLAPCAIVQEEDVGVSEPDMSPVVVEKVTDTEQLLLIAGVVYIKPSLEPPAPQVVVIVGL